jgi:hypothetical protein
MDDPKDIDEVILILQRERPVLTKDKKGQVGNQKTRYADLVQVNAVVLGRLNEMDTIWVCLPHIEGGVFGLHYQLRHVPSGTEKAGVWPLKLSENPQQMGSATSYGRRYALLAVTGIVSEEEDDDGAAASATPAGAGTARRAAVQQATAQRAQAQPPTPPRATASRAGAPPLPTDRQPASDDGPGLMITDKQLAKLHATLGDLGWNERAKGLAEISKIVDEPITSSKQLTKAEAIRVIDALETKLRERREADSHAADSQVAP